MNETPPIRRTEGEQLKKSPRPIQPSKRTESPTQEPPAFGASGTDTPKGDTALLRRVVELCHDAKGIDIAALYVAPVLSFADYFVIVSGRSDRQVQGICNKVLQGLSKEGVRPLAVEGLESGQWVLIDLEDVILHVFYEPLRDHYDLEGLWVEAERYYADPETAELIPARRAA